MKTFAVVLFFLLVGVGVQAQADTEEATVAPMETNDVRTLNNEATMMKNQVEVARLYKYKISRIKKALSFTSKRDRAKVV